MTTPVDIDAIRERADAALQTDERRQSALERWAEMPDRYAEDKLDRLIDETAAWVNPLTADIAALLAHVAQQTERVRTLEAALRNVEHALWETQEAASDELGDWDAVDDLYLPTNMIFARTVYEIARDARREVKKQAADALAANAGAGNGGA